MRWVSAQRRGLIDDHFGDFGGEAVAANGWRNFGSMFDASDVVDGAHGTQERSGQIALKRGRHACTVTFLECTGGESLSSAWAAPGLGKQADSGLRVVPPREKGGQSGENEHKARSFLSVVRSFSRGYGRDARATPRQSASSFSNEIGTSVLT